QLRAPGLRPDPAGVFPSGQGRFARHRGPALPDDQQAPPRGQERIQSALSDQDRSLGAAVPAIPGPQPRRPPPPRATAVHWVYAAVAATGFLLFLGLFFSVERANAAHLLGVGAFTGTIGIVFLFLVQLCSNLRLTRIRGRGIVIIILLILTFIGWSYDS